ncbi:hypothetical protein [Haloglomus salinum]|jgi:hypothetical protein|nr:hypothetical protein [Haloglomus salinum]
MILQSAGDQLFQMLGSFAGRVLLAVMVGLLAFAMYYYITEY